MSSHKDLSSNPVAMYVALFISDTPAYNIISATPYIMKHDINRYILSTEPLLRDTCKQRYSKNIIDALVYD